MKGLLDIDGVLLNSHQYFLQQMNTSYSSLIHKELRRPLELEDITTWGFDFIRNIIGIPFKKKAETDPTGIIDYIGYAYVQDEFDIEPVDPWVPEMANYIMDAFNMELVTSNENFEDMKHVLEDYGIRTDSLRWQKTKDTGQYGVLVEDNPTISFNENQIFLLRDQPWNRDLYADNIVRFSSSRQLPGLLRLAEEYQSIDTIKEAMEQPRLENIARTQVEKEGIAYMKHLYSSQ